MIRAIQQMTRPLSVRISNMVARAVVRAVYDGTRLQTLQLGVLEGETRDNVERVQEYGFTSVPLPGALAAVVFVGGRREHGLVLGVDDARHRPKGLEPGEVALYTDEFLGVLLKRGGVVELAGNTDAAALASKVEERLSALEQHAAQHTHAVATTGTAAAQSGTASSTGAVFAAPAVASEKVKLG